MTCLLILVSFFQLSGLTSTLSDMVLSHLFSQVRQSNGRWGGLQASQVLTWLLASHHRMVVETALKGSFTHAKVGVGTPSQQFSLTSHATERD